MKKCDQMLIQHSDSLNKVLSLVDDDNRSFVSQLVLSQLRHFVEHVMIKIYCEDNNVDMNDDWQNIQLSIEYVCKHGQYSFIRDFHSNHLQKSVSHKVESEDYSETLMLLYYKPLIQIKDFVFKNYGLDVLTNLNKYPLDLDDTFLNYYRSIQTVVFKDRLLQNGETGNYYVFKKRPIWVDKKLMFELTLGPANDYADKQDRFVAFSRVDVFDNYAIEADIIEDRVKCFDATVSIKIIKDYSVSIMTYELNNLAKILGCQVKVKRNQKEFYLIMQYIKDYSISLDKVALYSDVKFSNFSSFIKAQTNETPVLTILEKCRSIILNAQRGSNVLRYLLCHIKNTTIRYQISDNANPDISNLLLRNGTLPFEETPFAANLIGCKHSTASVFKCINDEECDCQLLAKRLGRQSDETGQLYVKKNTIYSGDNIDELITKYNSMLKSFHEHRRIEKYREYLYIKENEIGTVNIIRLLQKYARSGVPGYSYQARRWIASNEGNIRGTEKKAILENMFEKSRVFVLYGSAGTGKSTTVSFVLNILGNVSKLCLAPTHPAVDNMKRKINDPNANYYTIKKFLSDNSIQSEWDVVVIDECSVVSNRAMIEVLKKINCKAILLTGDIFQLPSIDFGNWFHIAKSLLPPYASFELTEQFRTDDNNLVTLWNKVRNFNDGIYEYLAHNEMTKILDGSVFNKDKDDQIILCYNYDGLYGINSINRYLQEKNPNAPVTWNQYVFKVDDPVIFHNTKRFRSVLHNNLKGKITKIYKGDNKITFEIAIDASLSSLSFSYGNIAYVGNLPNGWTIVRFSVIKYNAKEDDGEPQEIHTIPFQIAYAVSIHKSQGLEYDSVKIIIANNVDDLITHNVFYTAITRAKKKLMIYWTPESAKKVLSSFEKHFDEKDSNIIKAKYFSK